MRGSIIKRSASSYTVQVTAGYKTDPLTGAKTQIRKTFSVKGNKKAAEDKLDEVLRALKSGTFVEPTTQTFGQFITDVWLPRAADKKGRPWRMNTVRSYTLAANANLIPVLGDVLVHELTAEHLRQFYAEFGKTHKPGTVRNMAGILSSALWLARKRNLLALNIAYDAADTVPALDVDGLQDDTAEHVWSAAEVIKVLAEAKRTSPQWHAFYAVMLDSGCRKGEINGLRWTDINFEAGTVSFKQQLLRVGPPPVFGVLKRGGHRIIDVAPETMDALKKHRRTQKALKLASGTKYQDHGLVFQKTAADVTAKPGDALGLPLVLEHNYEFKKMIARARVTAITFHQMRHTVASLLLGAGVPVHVVAKRLGHKDGITTLKVYAKCLPSDQAEASARLRERIYG